MSLTEQTSQELTDLAKAMISEGVNTKPYRNFGTLVRMNSDEFKNFEGEVALGEIIEDNEKFVLYGN